MVEEMLKCEHTQDKFRKKLTELANRLGIKSQRRRKKGHAEITGLTMAPMEDSMGLLIKSSYFKNI